MNAKRSAEQEIIDLVNWPIPGPEKLRHWHLPHINLMPTRPQMFEQGMRGIAEGWLPIQPLIDANTRVFAMGSCFARNFIVWLAEHGFNQAGERSPYGELERLMSEFESVAVLAQQFRWAFGEVEASTLLWLDKDRRIVEATEEGRLRLRDALLGADVLIVTLGLSEIWHDQLTGEPLWHPLTKDKFDPARHVFRVESMEQTRHWLDVIESLRQRHMPQLKMIYTVSPIPLAATFRPVSAVTANCVSKSILRAALDEFFRSHASIVGKGLFYFPSYEFVTNLFGSPFQDDNRHLNNYVIGSVMSFFAENYCALVDARPRTAGSLHGVVGSLEEAMQLAEGGHAVTPELEAHHRIRELEGRLAELERVCAERAQLIEELDHAARERLALIEQLQKAADERLAGMQELSAIAAERLALIHSLEQKAAE